MSTSMASRDLQESAEGGASTSPHILAALILIAVVTAACALQVFTTSSSVPTTSYTACLGADGSIYGLGEGLSPASPCDSGDDTVQATMVRDGGR